MFAGRFDGPFEYRLALWSWRVLISTCTLVVFLGVLLFAGAKKVDAQQLDTGNLGAAGQPAGENIGGATGPADRSSGGNNGPAGNGSGGGSDPAGQGSALRDPVGQLAGSGPSVAPLTGGDGRTAGGSQGSNGLAGSDNSTSGGGGGADPTGQMPGSGTSEPVENTLGAATGSVNPVLEENTEPARQTLGGVTRPAGETVGTVAGPAGQALEEVTGPVRETVGGTTEPVEKTLDGVAGPVKQTTEPLLQPVDRTLNEATKPLEEVARPVEEAAGPVLDPITEATNPVLEPVREKLDPVPGPVNPIPADPGSGVANPPVQPVSSILDPTHGTVNPVAEPAALAISVVKPPDPAVPAASPVSTPVSEVARELVSTPSAASGASIPPLGTELAPAVKDFKASRYPERAELSYYGLLERSLRSLAGGYPTLVAAGGTENALNGVPLPPFAGTSPGTGSLVGPGSGGSVLLLGILAFLLILWQGGKRFWPPTGFLEPKSALHLVPVRPG